MIRAKIDTKDLEKSLKKLSKDINKTAEDTIKEMAQIGGVQLAYRTPPYGIGPNQKNILEKAVYKDVNTAYRSIGQTFNELRRINKNAAMGFARAIHENDLIEAEKYADILRNYDSIKTTDSGDYLERNRNHKGRVKDGVSPITITNDSELDRIKADKVITSGTCKAGFLQAAKSIGSKTRIAKWLKKNYPLGTSRVSKSGWKTVVTLINNTRYASSLVTEAIAKKAIENAYRNQIKKMDRILASISKRF